jgi:hypothetical protein
MMVAAKIFLTMAVFVGMAGANSVDKAVTKATVIFDMPRNQDGVISLSEDNMEYIL